MMCALVPEAIQAILLVEDLVLVAQEQYLVPNAHLVEVIRQFESFDASHTYSSLLIDLRNVLEREKL